MHPQRTAKTAVGPDGVAVKYWVTADRFQRKPWYVLHPGAALNHSSLARIEQGLNDLGHPTLVFDPRGSGISDHPWEREQYHLELLSGDLERMLAQEGIERPRFLTHSFGFQPAVDYAARTGNAEHLTGVCASHHFPDTVPSKLGIPGKVLFHLFDKVLIWSGFVGSAYTGARHLLRREPRGIPDQSVYRSDADLWLRIVDIDFAKAASHVFGQRECNTWDVTPQLSRLMTPLLLIYGGEDAMVSHQAGPMIEQQTKAPCNIDMVHGATHALPMSHPRAVLDLVALYAPLQSSRAP